MVVLREEVVGPTAASHSSGPAWRAGLNHYLVTYLPSGVSALGLSIRAGSISICNKFMEFVLKSLDGSVYSDAIRRNFSYGSGESVAGG